MNSWHLSAFVIVTRIHESQNLLDATFFDSTVLKTIPKLFSELLNKL